MSDQDSFLDEYVTMFIRVRGAGGVSAVMGIISPYVQCRSGMDFLHIHQGVSSC